LGRIHSAAGASRDQAAAELNALLDLDAGSIRFERDGQRVGASRLLSANWRILDKWKDFKNAAILGGAVRALLGVPRLATMQFTPSTGKTESRSPEIRVECDPEHTKRFAKDQRQSEFSAGSVQKQMRRG
jgi:hypothetical protein